MADDKQGKSKSDRAENAVVDSTVKVTKAASAVIGAAVIGTVKGLSKAIWRGVRPRRAKD